MKRMGLWLLLIMVCAAPALAARQSASPPSRTSAPSSKTTPPGGWAPELLFGILNSSNPQAAEELYRAAFAAGPVVIPQLQAALRDDRTSEFAAQSLAYIGGKEALQILAGLEGNSSDPGLRRFYYGALGEFSSPRATDILLNAIRNSSSQPDRTVAESAVIALTVHTDAALAPRLRELAKHVSDFVIQDDLQNASDVIEARARYFASPEGKKSGGSIDHAIHTYFIPAFEVPPDDGSSGSESKRARSKAAKPPVDVRIENLTFSPDQSRALAHVIFETPEALANYEMVLQKKFGDWTLASVWLGAEMEKQSGPASPGTQ